MLIIFMRFFLFLKITVYYIGNCTYIYCVCVCEEMWVSEWMKRNKEFMISNFIFQQEEQL